MNRREERIERMRRAAVALRRAERPVRILRYVAWPPHIAEKFFAHQGKWLPRVVYPRKNLTATLEATRWVRSIMKNQGPAELWLKRQARQLEYSVRMLNAVGTSEFFRYSRMLYGLPSETIVDGRTTSMALAQRIDRVLSHYEASMPGPPLKRLSARQFRSRLATLVRQRFGDAGPEVVLVDRLSAKVTAGATHVRVRATARFQESDVRSMFMHEVMVHSATALNGVYQRKLPVLAAGHAGTVRTQEGLAVFSELITGSLSPHRFRRLANRVIAVQLAADGADFVELYRFFLERTGDPKESFEDARRVVRGGVVEGGAPFTKDGVYLDGLLRVANFLRAAVDSGRPDLLRLLFCGRLDLDDIPMIAGLWQDGLVEAPVHLPPWMDDPGFLVGYLTYSSFLDRVRLKGVRAQYRSLFQPSVDVTGLPPPPPSKPATTRRRRTRRAD